MWKKIIKPIHKLSFYAGIIHLLMEVLSGQTNTFGRREREIILDVFGANKICSYYGSLKTCMVWQKICLKFHPKILVCEEKDSVII